MLAALVFKCDLLLTYRGYSFQVVKMFTCVLGVHCQGFCPLHNIMVRTRNCLAYVMLPPLRRELNEFKDNWNNHLIRKNKLADCPAGVPNELYDYPSLKG